MSEYNGFQFTCGCTCSRCGAIVQLEGYADASGAHYCSQCDDYVYTSGACNGRKKHLVEQREARIVKAGALDD